MRWASGIWPPSNPRRKPSLRAFCPFWPRPEVLPRPEPVPRPIRSGRRWAPFEGLRSCSCILLLASRVLLVRAGPPDLVLAALGANIGRAFDGDQEVHRLEHAADGRVVRQIAGLVHAAKTERLHGCLDLRQSADGALHQGGPDRPVVLLGGGFLPGRCLLGWCLLGCCHFVSAGVGSAPLVAGPP